MLFVIILILAVIAFIIIKGKSPISIKAHWQTFLDGIQIPAKEFYGEIKAGLADRQITKVAITEESFLEKHLFSAKRLYLRITQDEYVYYICSAPYGTGTFISSWLCVKDENIANKIPVLSKLAGKDRSNKTFYQMDTEAMFQSAVHATLMDIVNSMSEAKGMRGLTEIQKQFKVLA